MPPVAPGLTTRSKDVLVAPGLTTRSNKATIYVALKKSRSLQVMARDTNSSQDVLLPQAYTIQIVCLAIESQTQTQTWSALDCSLHLKQRIITLFASANSIR